MYHSAPPTRFNNISPSSRSNYQLASMRDFTRQQTLQTSFIENGNGNQRLLQQNTGLAVPGVGNLNGNGANGLPYNANGAGGNSGGGGPGVGSGDPSLRPNSNLYLNGVDAQISPTASPTGGGGERSTNGLGLTGNVLSNGSNSNSNFAPPP